MRSLITCLGECLIDFLPVAKEDAGDTFQMRAGGSIFNVAMGAARMGQAAAFSCKVADDYFGRFLRAHIESEHIDTRFLIHHTGGHSTLAFVAIEDGSPAFTFYNDGASDTRLSIDELPQGLFAETAILHFGSISLLQGTTPDAILTTAERLKGQALLSFDPNIRPDLIQNETQYRARLQRAFALADVVKLSDVDLAWLHKDLTVEQAIHEILALGPGLVVITRGSHGIIAARAGGPVIKTPSYSIQLADAVGAGDTFCAALLVQLMQHNFVTPEELLHLQDNDLVSMLRFAGAAAAINCTRIGADPPHYTEIEEFIQQHEQ
jgi:Sugar kinases, ribokinase family